MITITIPAHEVRVGDRIASKGGTMRLVTLKSTSDDMVTFELDGKMSVQHRVDTFLTVERP